MALSASFFSQKVVKDSHPFHACRSTPSPNAKRPPMMPPLNSQPSLSSKAKVKGHYHHAKRDRILVLYIFSALLSAPAPLADHPCDAFSRSRRASHCACKTNGRAADLSTPTLANLYGSTAAAIFHNRRAFWAQDTRGKGLFLRPDHASSLARREHTLTRRAACHSCCSWTTTAVVAGSSRLRHRVSMRSSRNRTIAFECTTNLRTFRAVRTPVLAFRGGVVTAIRWSDNFSGVDHITEAAMVRMLGGIQGAKWRGLRVGREVCDGWRWWRPFGFLGEKACLEAVVLGLEFK